jgi:hypothetical protein
MAEHKNSRCAFGLNRHALQQVPTQPRPRGWGFSLLRLTRAPLISDAAMWEVKYDRAES